MTTDHRAAAEMMLADADEWTAQAEEPTPEVGERSCLAYAAVHALLAIHDTLTAADRYAANEAKQREAEPDPLDEDDHRDRVDRRGDRLIWHRDRHWHYESGTCGDWCRTEDRSLAKASGLNGPLTFAPEAAQEAPSTATSADAVKAEREADPLDEGDHRDRMLVAISERIVRVGHKHWHTPGWANCNRRKHGEQYGYSLEGWNASDGPLTFAPDADGAPSVTAPAADDPADDAVDGEEDERRYLNAQDAELSRLLAVSTDPTAALRRAAMMEAVGVTDDQAKWFAQILAKGRLLPDDLQRLKAAVEEDDQ